MNLFTIESQELEKLLKDLRGNEFKVYIFIKDLYDRKGSKVLIDYDLIQEKLNLSRGTAVKCVKSLMDKKYIDRELAWNGSYRYYPLKRKDGYVIELEEKFISM